MIWPFNKKIFFKRSSLWPKIRSEYLQTNPICEICGSKNKPEVHHIIPVHVDPSKELDINNLITLCDKYCHFIFGHLMNWKSYNIHIKQDAMEFNNKISNRP